MKEVGQNKQKRERNREKLHCRIRFDTDNTKRYYYQIYLEPDTDSGWENPFRPGGDLSREADEIVELIKEGKPITPTPGSTSPKLQNSLDETDTAKLSPEDQSPTKTLSNDLTHSPKSPVNNQNGNTLNEKSPGQLDIQRTTLIQPSDASQVEHVIIKKKNKCQCCVIQ